MAVNQKKGRAYGLTSPLINVNPEPIISSRAPNTRDRSELGTPWVKQDQAAGDNVYMITSVVANVATWTSLGGGAGQFDAVTVNPGNLTVTAGNTILTAGDLTLGAGSVTVTPFAALGIVANNAAGVLSTTRGTDGQFLISDTATGPDWGEITSAGGTCVVTYPSANTLNIEATGGTANSYATDAGGPVAPLAGVLNVIGYDANITTDGATANTVEIRLADDVITVGALTAGVNLNMDSGICTISSNSNAIEAIYLHANGGTAEQIKIHSDQGTSVDSVSIESDVGGVYITSGLGAVDAIDLAATDVAGGISASFGTSGMEIVGTNGSFVVETGTGDIEIGVDAVAKDISFGNATGASSLTLAAGTGDYTSTSTGTMTLDSAGVLELNSSAGIISIGNKAVAQNIEIGTGGAARVITIGNSTGASQVVLNCGTDGVSIGTSANAHTSTFGSTNTTSAATIQAGSGAMTFTAGGIWDVNAVGAVTIDSTGGALSIGSGAHANGISIGNGIAARTIVMGNATGTTSIALNTGTGALELGSNAIAHQVRVGSVTGAANTTVQAGSGALVINGGANLNIDAATDITMDSAGGIFDLSVTGDITIDSNAGTIGIGVDDFDQAINIGTSGERLLTFGNQVGAAGVVVESGTAGMQLKASGLTSVEVASDTQAASTVTVSANNGYGTFTGLTTAAAASQVLTVTNTLCAATSAILCTVSDLSANDSKMTIQRVTPAAGSFSVAVLNEGSQAVNGNLMIAFWLMA